MRFVSHLSFVCSFIVCAMLLGVASTAFAGEWREGSPSSTGHALSASAILGEEIYLAGGAGITAPQNNFEAYDTVGDIWRSLPPIPVGLQQAAMANVGGRLFLTGGFSAESKGADVRSLWVFDPAIGIWVQGADMPGPRAWHQMVGVDGKLYVMGGIGSHAERIFEFDPVTGDWRTLTNGFPQPRSAFAVAVQGGEIYVIGGRLTNGAATARVDVFKPSTGAWREAASLPASRAGAGATVLNGQVHVVGGEQLSPPRTFDDHYVLASDGRSWEKSEPLSTPRHGVVVAGVGNRLYVVGGATGPGVYTVFTVSDLVDIYKP
ncbi:MAG: kelch repeat-containing protein [Parvibaculum sp.]